MKRKYVTDQRVFEESFVELFPDGRIEAPAEYVKLFDEINNVPKRRRNAEECPETPHNTQRDEMPRTCNDCPVGCGELLDYGESACKRRVARHFARL
jgi:hypothetical protein